MAAAARSRRTAVRPGCGRPRRANRPPWRGRPGPQARPSRRRRPQPRRGLVSVIVMRYLSRGRPRAAPAARSRRPDPMSGGTLPTALDRSEIRRPAGHVTNRSAPGRRAPWRRTGSSRRRSRRRRPASSASAVGSRTRPTAPADEQDAEHDGRDRVDPAQAGHGHQHERAEPQRQRCSRPSCGRPRPRAPRPAASGRWRPGSRRRSGWPGPRSAAGSRGRWRRTAPRAARPGCPVTAAHPTSTGTAPAAPPMTMFWVRCASARSCRRRRRRPWRRGPARPTAG